MSCLIIAQYLNLKNNFLFLTSGTLLIINKKNEASFIFNDVIEAGLK